MDAAVLGPKMAELLDETVGACSSIRKDNLDEIIKGAQCVVWLDGALKYQTEQLEQSVN